MKLYLFLSFGLVACALLAIRDSYYFLGLLSAFALLYVAIVGPKDFEDER